MKIITETNILVRAAVQEDPAQARYAMQTLETEDLIAVLCERRETADGAKDRRPSARLEPNFR